MTDTPDFAEEKPGALDSSNAIWDDGEWISWEDINRHLAEQESGTGLDLAPAETPALTMAEKRVRFEEKLQRARTLDYNGRRDEIDFGELGELYAEIRHGLVRHPRKDAEGSDGKIGDAFAEVKTITPWKSKLRVAVKRSGHFSMLIVVKFDEHLMPDSRIIARSILGRGKGGKVAKVSWETVRKKTGA